MMPPQGYVGSRGPWSREWNRPAPSATLRVSNADRAEVTNALCRHFADGRLDEAEFNDRAARAAAAKTQVDLAHLLTDLPTLQEVVPVHHTKPGWLSQWALVAIGVLAVLTWSIAGVIGGLNPVRVPWILVAIVAFVVLRRRHRRW